MQTAPQLESVSLVLLGQFNPAIFQPAWFAVENLVRPQEAESAEVQLIHPEATVLRMEWLQLNIVRNRFQASTLQSSYFEPLRDLIVGLFSLLNHTPVIALGINREFHFRLDSEKQWHKLGDRLAPKQHWQLLKKPGLRSLSIEGQRDDGYEGHLLVRVEPSPRYEQSIYVEVNDHYELRAATVKYGGVEKLIEILTSQWTRSMERSEEFGQKLVAIAAED